MASAEPWPLRVLEHATGLVHMTQTRKHTYKPFIEEYSACGIWVIDNKGYEMLGVLEKVTCIDCLAKEAS